MKKIRVNVEGVTPTAFKSHNSYALILTDDLTNKKKLPIIIGLYEAQYISLVLERVKTPRPLTHDLLLNIIKKLGAQIQEVVISKLEKGVFFSNIILKKEDETIQIDSRTSDAVALALKSNVPIYIYEHIFEDNAVAIDEILKEKKVQTSNDNVSTEDKSEKEKKFELMASDLLVDELFSLKTKSNHWKIKNILKQLTLRKLKEMLDIAINKEMYEIAAFIRDEIEDKEKDK